jgi:hypothetical protein
MRQGALSAFGGVCEETVSLVLSNRRSAALLHVVANSTVALLASLLLLAHHSRYRRLERAASTISKLVRRRSARKQLAELRRLTNAKEELDEHSAMPKSAHTAHEDKKGEGVVVEELQQQEEQEEQHEQHEQQEQ